MNQVKKTLTNIYICFKVFIFFKSPLFSLNTVVPETKISTPASTAILEVSKLIPPSISILKFNFSFLILSKSLIFGQHLQ